MDVKKRERERDAFNFFGANYIRIHDETRGFLKDRWFGNATIESDDEDQGLNQEQYTREKLKAAQNKGYSEQLTREMDKALDYISTQGMNLLLDWIENRNTSNDVRYYVAYQEIEDRLHMYILYSIEQDVPILEVEYMGLACQGVWVAVQQGGRNRERLHDLFKSSMQSIREELQDTRYAVARLNIYVGTPGSASVMNATFKGGFFPPNPYTVDLDDICSHCQIGAPILTLKHVGGAFCSQKCAKQFWETLAWMEHPITESCFITF
jgi:hypothetical protein